MISLFISIYNEKNNVRMAEYLFCLNKNIENRFIDRIFILCEAGYRINMNCNKLKYFYIPERPKFCDFFKLINNITASDDINIISNSDIFLMSH